MSEKPTGRVLRPIAEMEAEEKERRIRREDRDHKKILDLLPPTDPEELKRWEQEQREEEDSYRRFSAFINEEEAELQAVKDGYPLGTVRPREPRSIHSPVPQPPWKRKPRP